MNKKILTRANIMPLIVLFISVLLLICMAFSILELINHILIGLFGICAYFLLILIIAGCVAKIFGYKNRFTKSFVASLTIIAFSMLFIIHVSLTSSSYNLSFVECMEYPFATLTPAGAIFSFVLYPLRLLLPLEAVICLFVVIFIVFLCICIDKQYHYRHVKTSEDFILTKIEKIKTPKTANVKTQTMRVPISTMENNKQMPTFISMPLTLNAKVEKEENETLNDLIAPIISKPINIKREEKKNSNKTDPTIYNGIINSDIYNTNLYNTEAMTLEDANEIANTKPLKPQKIFVNDGDDIQIMGKPQTILYEKTKNNSNISPILDTNDVSKQEFSNENNEFSLKNGVHEENETLGGLGLSKNDDMIFQNKLNIDDIQTDSINDNDKFLNNITPTKEIRKETPKPKKRAKYIRPPLELLTTQSSIPTLSQEKFEEKAHIIEEKFEEFKISVKCVGVTRGPAITRYEFEMPQGITVNKVLQYSNDISMVLESKKTIRIEAPIPGKNAFGIEVPNEKVDTVGLRDILDTKEFKDSRSPLTFALGRDITNKPVLSDVGKLVHTLVAGSTGSGKSVCMNTIIISLLYKASPADVRIILIDPKFVEFNIYENLPHLLLPKIITEPAQAVSALAWACEEMERRNRIFGQHYVRSIDEFNDLSEVKDGTIDKMYKIVIMVDELADLMINTRKEIEEKILKLSQKARSSGIHLILATQRPSVDIITGTIKANLPSRIAFSLTNYNDSKTIIDQGGAEKLLGRGDMLYCPRGEEPTRLLGPFISQHEVASIVKFIKENNPCDYDPEIEKAIMVEKSTEASFGEESDASSDEYFVRALRNVIETQICSASSIQRRFRIGYNRAARIVQTMEDKHYISKFDGAKPRQIFITMDEFLRLYGDKG